MVVLSGVRLFVLFGAIVFGLLFVGFTLGVGGLIVNVVSVYCLLFCFVRECWG